MNSRFSSFKIPVDLFLEIQLFLNDRDYWMLLSTANKSFEDARFSTRKIALDKAETVRFLDESDYFRLILDKVQSPGRQLSLCIERECHFSFPVNEITLYKLLIPNWQQLFSLASKLNLNLNDDISEFPFFPNLHSMKLSAFSELTTLSNLSHLKKLSIQDCWELSDVSCLRSLEDLTIDNSYITDVSELGKIRYLTLSFCFDLKDISKLMNNYKLCITGCNAINSVPEVFNSTILMISVPLMNTKTTSDFPRLKTVTVSDWRLDPFICCFPLQNLFSLELGEVYGLKKLFPEIHRIPLITLNRCPDLEDISDLGENKSVKIYYCQKIKDFSCLKHVLRILIHSCVGFGNAHDVKNVQHLTIYGRTNFKYKRPLKKLRRLELLCWVNDLDPGIWDIPVLEVGLALALTYFPMVQLNNEKIIIHDMGETIPMPIIESTRNYDMTRYKKQIIFLRKGK
jgi:hypothetical protein